MVGALLPVWLLALALAVGVLGLLRAPIRYPGKPASRGFLVAVLGLSAWLAFETLSGLADGRGGAVATSALSLAAASGCSLGVLLLAVEYARRRLVSRRVLQALGAIGGASLSLLATNALWLHEFVYRRSTTGTDGAVALEYGPGFPILAASTIGILALSIGVVLREVARSGDARRRQAGLVAVGLAPALLTVLYWLVETPDPTGSPAPFGVVAGFAVVGWALYRTSYLDIVPVAREIVVEGMTDAVVTLDADDRVIDWNDAAIELFGVDRSEPGVPADEFFAPLSPAARSALDVAEPTETQFSFERDGSRRHCSALVSPIGVRDGDRPWRVVTVRDVTASVRRERRLVEQNDSLESFAEIVSHDVQGPLMELRASADLAGRTGGVDEVENTLHAVDRMEELVEELLSLARTGDRLGDPEVVALDAVATRAWQGVWGVDAALVVATDRAIVADPNRLQQLLENLFRNSVEHSSTSPASQAQQDSVEHGSTNPRTSSTRQDAVEHSVSDEPSLAGAREDAEEQRSSSLDSHARRDAVEGGSTIPAPQASRDTVEQSVSDEPSLAGAREDAVVDHEVSDAGSGDGEPAVTVTVGTFEDGFYVEDDGVGIPPDERERVFDRGVSQDEDGTGLGLSIVRQVADAHGWSVRVVEGTDGGARIEVADVSFAD